METGVEGRNKHALGWSAPHGWPGCSLDPRTESGFPQAGRAGPCARNPPWAACEVPGQQEAGSEAERQLDSKQALLWPGSQ